MTATNDETNKAAVAAVFGALENNWGWLLAFGIISILLGGVGIYMTFGLTLATVVFFGALMLARPMLERVDWDLLILFVGLFIVNGAFAKAGLATDLVTWLRTMGID